jgi:elongation factor Ts
MAEITAATVMKLRKMSGQGMMDCKKALEETNGNLEEAMTLLRKKGLATMEKRAGRDTSEGRIVVKTLGDTVVMSSLCCETDFVAKNDDFIEAAELLADYVLACDCDGGQKVEDVELNGKKFSEVITDLVSKTGEKTEVGDCAKYQVGKNCCIGTYVHFNNKIGAIVEIEAGDEAVAASEQLKTIANDVCMHITATKPLALNKDSFDADVIEKERAIATEQVKDKPANIIEKIVDGKINKFLADNCLVNQKFVKNEEITVEQAVAQAAKAAGGQAVIKRFERLEIA